MSQELVLYDLPSRSGKAWSPNTWKVRLVLNYKKIPYRTEWVEFPDIKPTFEKLGIPPNKPGDFADYTVPVVRFTDGSYIMGIDPIVARLESMHPDPPLRLETGLQDELGPLNGKVLGPLIFEVFPRVRRRVLNEYAQDWFKKDREQRLGMPEEQYEQEKGGEVAWKKAEEGQREVANFLKEKKQDEGPFILGSKVTFADFSLAGRCEFFTFLGDDAYEKLVQPIPGLRELHKACQPWMEKND